MKKIMLAMLIGIISTVAMAQTKDATKQKKQVEVPAIVKQSFEKEYPKTKVKWEAEGDGFEAEFQMNGKDASAFYDKDGDKKELEEEIQKQELPASVIEYVKKNYSDYQITETSKITANKLVICYEVEVKKDDKKTDLIFDSKGVFIKGGFKSQMQLYC